MKRSREQVATLLVAGGWIAAFVALWALAGCLAILIYRAEQIGAHRCLRSLPLPSVYLQVGLVALVLAATLGVAALLARTEKGPRIWRAMIAAVAISGTLSLAVIVFYSMAPSPKQIRADACTGSSLDYAERLT